MIWRYSDGGRAAAGYTARSVGDCVCRAIAIVTEVPYLDVYQTLNQGATRERPSKGRARSTARNGVHRRTYEPYLFSLGYVWCSTMQIGSGCTVHLRPEELPAGRLIVAVSKHLTAVIDGVVYDTHDPSRDGSRCVYGYYQKYQKRS